MIPRVGECWWYDDVNNNGERVRGDLYLVLSFVVERGKEYVSLLDLETAVFYERYPLDRFLERDSYWSRFA